MLWLRPLDTTVARPLGGTQAASNPFWSPDSQSVGFFDVSTNPGKLKRIDLATGAVQTLADTTGQNGAWSTSNVIVYRRPDSPGPVRISASGGESLLVAKLPSGATFLDPQFLPDGRQFLFFSNGAEEVRGIYLGSLDDPQVYRLTEADGPGRYLPPGWLGYLRQGALVARRLNLTAKSLYGDAVLIAEKVMWNSQGARRAGFSISAKGVIAYRAERPSPRQLTWFDRNGKVLGILGQPDDALASPELSPDGKTAVVVRRSSLGAGLGAGERGSGAVELWLIDAMHTSRLPFDQSDYPIWSPSSRRIGFLALRNGKYGEYARAVDGSGDEEILAEKPATVSAFNALTDWSRDGRFALFDVLNPGPDVWVLPLTGERKPRPFLNGSYQERLAHFSPPDGRWVAYESHESGRAEIYVTPFPGPAGHWPVSTGGGAQPRWRHDGKELYWIAPDGKLMAAPISADGKPGAPVVLFQTKIYLGGTDQPQRGQYNVAPDGKFLINTLVNDDVVFPITIVQNWRPK